MRALRILAASVWYFVCTAVNNREPLFWSALERARFMRVLDEARKRYVFELRGLRFCGPWVSFYIKPADGLQCLRSCSGSSRRTRSATTCMTGARGISGETGTSR
ncbi:MAG: hypothetical protein LBK61_13740 [Spirochaetaceae bacterium]|nr:hypothetical protein [Spirochaetaceae bacterium]